MPAHIRRANAVRATVRSAIEHVFAAQKSVGIARARAPLALANIAYDMIRLAWLERRTAPT